VWRRGRTAGAGFGERSGAPAQPRGGAAAGGAGTGARRRLAAQNNISDAELTRRESEAEQATAAVNEQRARIAQKTLRAPFAGELGIRQVNVGQYVSPGDPVVSLQSVDPIYVNFNLPERRVAEVERGQEVNVRVDARSARSSGA
jgi:membrane fusion protein, multidrug efflux system